MDAADSGAGGQAGSSVGGAGTSGTGGVGNAGAGGTQGGTAGSQGGNAGAGGSPGGAAGSAGTGGSPGGAGGSAGEPGLCPPGSEPVVLASVERAYGIELDGTDVYFTSALDNGAIGKVPKAGGPTTLLTTGAGRPRNLALTDDWVYFTMPISGRVAGVKKDGSQLVNLAEFQNFPQGIVARGSELFWLRSSAPGGRLVGHRLTTGEYTEYATDLADPWALVRRGSHLWFNTRNTAQLAGIWRYNLSDERLDLVAPMDVGANDIGISQETTADRAVYITTNASVRRVEEFGGAVTTVAQGTFLDGIWVEAGQLFFTERTETGAIYRLDTPAGDVTRIASAQANPRRVTSDGECLYWTNQGPFDGVGSVVRGPRR